MKLMTVFAVVSLAIAGTACSESKTNATPESADTVTVEADTGGTLNLSLTSVTDETETEGGTLNLNLGGVGSDEPRMIGSDQLTGVDFGEVPEPAFAVDPETAPADEDDDIIRLPPN